MAIQYLLPREGSFYKANLHAHSTLSDGALTPEQLRDAYRAQGYSILCITDHERIYDHSDLDLPDFLMLTGIELGVAEANPRKEPSMRKCCHMNLFAPKAECTRYVCISEEEKQRLRAEGVSEEDLPKEPFERVYTPECINTMVRTAHETGFLCSYNHPTWSLETDAEYTAYKGFDMMEIVNYSCIACGLDEQNSRVYDAMLRAGRRLAASAADDNHNALALDDPLSDSFGGYVWIKAPELSYDAVWEALRYGDFYACAGGPEIRELTYEDGVVHIECSGAERIAMTNANRSSKCFAARRGEVLYRADFAVTCETGFFRLELTGTDGRRSYTRAYFLDELNG